MTSLKFQEIFSSFLRMPPTARDAFYRIKPRGSIPGRQGMGNQVFILNIPYMFDGLPRFVDVSRRAAAMQKNEQAAP